MATCTYFLSTIPVIRKVKDKTKKRGINMKKIIKVTNTKKTDKVTVTKKETTVVPKKEETVALNVFIQESDNKVANALDNVAAGIHLANAGLGLFRSIKRTIATNKELKAKEQALKETERKYFERRFEQIVDEAVAFTLANAKK